MGNCRVNFAVMCACQPRHLPHQRPWQEVSCRFLRALSSHRIASGTGYLPCSCGCDFLLLTTPANNKQTDLAINRLITQPSPITIRSVRAELITTSSTRTRSPLSQSLLYSQTSSRHSIPPTFLYLLGVPFAGFSLTCEPLQHDKQHGWQAFIECGFAPRRSVERHGSSKIGYRGRQQCC